MAATFAAVVFAAAAIASPLDSMPPDPAATLVRAEETVTVPGAGPAGPGVVAAPLNLTARAFLAIDFAVQPDKQLTLLVMTSAQKQQMDSGSQIQGRPVTRQPIDGTASIAARADAGDYYVVVLNENAQPVWIDYRVSARAF